MKIKVRVIEWIKRYAPAEVLSLAFTLLSAGLTFSYTENYVASAFAGTWGGNLGFFGYILVSDIIYTVKVCRTEGTSFGFRNVWIIIRGLIVEFGLAEVADSFFIRPFLMYYFPILIGDFSTGIFLAKLCADITFYIPAIFFYESNKILIRKIKDRDRTGK